MKSNNRTVIRNALEAHLLHAGDLAYFPINAYPPYTPQRLRVAISQIISELPYQATARTIGDHIVVRRDTIPANVLPGTDEPYILLACRPWPDDPHYDQKMRALRTDQLITVFRK